MHITPRAIFHENINELWSKCYEFDGDNETVPDNIPNPYTQKDTPTYKPWGWDGTYIRKVAGHRH